MSFAVAGRFPGEDYVDARCSGDPSTMGNLDMNLGRMPILETAEGSIGQSSAITYYVAQLNNQLGDNALQAGQILSFVEHIEECREAYLKVVPWGSVPTKEQQDTWFGDDVASDKEGVADGSKRSKRFLKWFAGRLEALAGDNGHLVGERCSIADIYLFMLFADNLDEKLHEDMESFKREAFGNAARTAEVLAAHPKLQQIVEKVAADANMQKWLQTRGKQGF